MNVIRQSLTRIFGEKMPHDATHFHTVMHVGVFIVPKNGKTSYINIPFNQQQKTELKERGILGTFGWALD
jgi:hypothetical protein